MCNSNKGIIDLTPLGKKDSARYFFGVESYSWLNYKSFFLNSSFNNIQDPLDSKTKYSFNPCYKFNKDLCISTYVCEDYIVIS